MKQLVGIVFFLLPFVSSAHPGHGSTAGSSIVHYLREPLHLTVGLFTLILLLYILQRAYKKLQSDQDNS